MKRILIVLGVIYSSIATASPNFEEIFQSQNAKVILTDSGILDEGDISRYGKSACSNKQICVLWFYSNRQNAEIGAKAMKQGDMFAVTPGMYGIFSKNNIANNVICYEPLEGC